MKELVRSNDPALLSFLQDLLQQSDINFLLADQHMSMTEGMIGIFQKRILVPDDEFNDARRIMREADIGDEISQTHNSA